jgi:hypothetical protein
MATAQQNTFDGRKLADLIGLIDSPVEAEAAGAVHRIRVLKKKHGDVPFYALVETEEYKAAAWEKFGGCASPCDAGGKCHHGPEGLRAWFEAKHGGGNSGELTEARTLLEKLRQDNAQLEKDGAALAHAVKRQEQIIGELRQQGTARPGTQAVDAAAGPAHEYFGGLFAFAGVMGAAALLFVCSWHVVAAVVQWIGSF